MNEYKIKKGTKYSILKDEDIHTITGALKQFFRELKTPLIPLSVYNNLPNDLGNFQQQKYHIEQKFIIFFFFFKQNLKLVYEY